MHAQTGASRWEVATRPIAPALASFVRDAVGYTEWTPGPLARREFPAPQVVVILELGPPIRVTQPRDGARTAACHPGGFVAGLHDGFALTEHDGFQHGLQLNLTPHGARGFFGVPMSELAGRVVPLPDLLPRGQRNLVERLRDLPSWDARFDLLEHVVAERLRDHAPRLEPVEWAARRIEASGGAADIGALVRELGYSHKHTLRLFREHVGVAPKLLARIVRFDRLLQHVRSGQPGGWAELAARYGYYDQAHLARDVKHFTGATPTQVRSAALELGELFG